MSRLAPILMFCAWLLYGSMPAVAMPLMPMTHSDVAIEDHSRHPDHGRKTEPAKAVHSHDDSQKPCPHGGKTCVMPFCAACLTLLPDADTGSDSPFVHTYPAPGIGQTLTSAGPAPLTPPPRT